MSRTAGWWSSARGWTRERSKRRQERINADYAATMA
jgi:hypothetical protein